MTEICNSVVTEEDCKNQIIQDALNVNAEKDLSDIWNEITSDFTFEAASTSQNNTFHVLSEEQKAIVTLQNSTSEEELLSGKQKEIPILEASVCQENISPQKGSSSDKLDQPHFSLQFQNISIDDEENAAEIEESDNESVMACLFFFKIIHYLKNLISIS